MGLPCVRPLGFIPGGARWVRDTGAAARAGAACLMPIFFGDTLALDARTGKSPGPLYSSWGS